MSSEEKKKTSTRFINGPLYYPDQVYPKPKNAIIGPIIAVWGMVSMWLFPYAGWYYSTLNSYLVALIIHTIPFIMDYYWSDATIYNIRRLNYHGYSTPMIYANMFINHVGGTVPFFMTGRLERMKLPADYQLIPTDEPLSSFLLRCLLQLAVAAVYSDIGFHFIHSCLHRYIPKLHFMHHINVRTSLITAIIIHPLDLVLSGMPMTTIPIILYWIFGDVSIRIFLHPFLGSIYHVSHDEWLQMPHAKHHANLNTHYYAYYHSIDETSKSDRKDCIRSMVLKHEINESNGDTKKQD